MRLPARRVASLLRSTSVAFAVCGVLVWHHASAQQPAAPAANPPTDVVAEYLKQYEKTPRENVPVMRGGAAVLIVKFTDFQCPGCAATYKFYKPVIEKYQAEFPGAVKYVVKDFPLDQSCASWLTQPLHTASCDAAVAAVLAKAQNHGPEMEDWLYSNQQLLTKDTVRKAASIIGNVTDFNGGYAAAMNQVKTDISLGRILNVSSTPTFFINGVRITQSPRVELFDAVIAYELKKAGKMK